jgi:integrase
MTFGEFLEVWLARVKDSIEPRTLERHQMTACYILPHLGKVGLQALTPWHIAVVYGRMQEGGCSADQRFKSGRLIRQVLKAAIGMGVISKNVALAVPLPKPTRKEMTVLTPEQIPAFLEAAAHYRLHALFVTAYDSGARQGELFALNWDDWLPQSRELVITKSLEEMRGQLRIKVPKTKASIRRVTLSPATAEVLEAHRARMAQEGHGSQIIFCDRVGGGYLRKSNVGRQVFKPLLKRAGLPDIRFHDLRHTCATHLLAAGVDVKSVAARLGHANAITVMNTYAHVLPAMQGRMADIIQGISTRSHSSQITVNGAGGEGPAAVSP